MEPIDYLRALQRRWILVVLAVVIGVAAGLLTSTETEENPATFKATHTLSVIRPSANADIFSTPLVTFTPSQLAVYTTVGRVPQRAVTELAYEGTPQRLAGMVDAEPDDIVGVLRISVTDTDGEWAAQVANTFAAELRTVISGDVQREVSQDIADGRQRVDDLQIQVATLDARIASDPADVGVLTARRDALVNQYRIAYDELQLLRTRMNSPEPVVSLESAVPQEVSQGFGAPQGPVARGFLFGLIGLVLGAALALILDRFDTRVRTKADVESLTTFPVLAEIPYLPRRHRGELVTVTRPSSPFAEAYRNLRTTLAFNTGGPREDGEHAAAGNGLGPDGSPTGSTTSGEPEVILITSPGPYEGKSTTVAHLAASYAESGRSVLVLDCDFRRPRLHKIFGTRESPGLSDTLVDPRQFAADDEVISATSIENLRLVPAGTPTDNPARLFAGARSVVQASRSAADVVLIDTPPLLVANDAAEFIPFVDGVLVVVQARRTRRENAITIAEQLIRSEAPVVGAVLVGTDEARSSYGTYYYYRANARTEKARRGWRRLLRLGPPKVKGDVARPAAADEDTGAAEDVDEEYDEPNEETVVDEPTGSR